MYHTYWYMCIYIAYFITFSKYNMQYKYICLNQAYFIIIRFFFFKFFLMVIKADNLTMEFFLILLWYSRLFLKEINYLVIISAGDLCIVAIWSLRKKTTYLLFKINIIMLSDNFYVKRKRNMFLALKKKFSKIRNILLQLSRYCVLINSVLTS